MRRGAWSERAVGRGGAVAALVVLLAGCAVTRWTKPGATRAQYERDNAECEQYAEFYGLLDEDKYLRCMAGKGYRRE